MKRKIHITESQLQEIAKKISNGLNEDSDEVLNIGQGTCDNMSLQQQAALATKFKNSDFQTGEVNFYGNQVKQGENPANLVKAAQDGAQQIMRNGLGECITKRQIKEARLNKLVRESFKVIKKKNLK